MWHCQLLDIINGLEKLSCRQPRQRKQSLKDRGIQMKADIHPNYSQIKVTCACGNEFETGSTLGKDLNVEICSDCHPFYTGKQKVMDTAGRVGKFKERYGRK